VYPTQRGTPLDPSRPFQGTFQGTA
jgi:hypothetical protein